jgi:protein-S-isoprenylcysteine O-methyltransferase Ste14
MLAVVAVVLMAGALALGGYTLGTHRRRLALWHQDDDAPEHLVEEGPYARIRHPFYTSYLISLSGCVLAAPHGVTAAVLVFVAYRLNRTAAREEARFLASERFGARYRTYMRRTGRFLPVLAPQSARSATAGGVLAARAAGTRLAPAATARKTTETPTSVTGSAGLTP